MSDFKLENYEIEKLQKKKIELRDDLLDWIGINFSNLNQYERDVVLLSIFKNCFESQLTVLSKVYGVNFNEN